MPALLCVAQSAANYLRSKENLPNARMNLVGFAAFMPQSARDSVCRRLPIQIATTGSGRAGFAG
jgi:hypothetical protein